MQLGEMSLVYHKKTNNVMPCQYINFSHSRKLIKTEIAHTFCNFKFESKMKTFATLTSITFLNMITDMVLGHGYMKSPRSRNFKAYEDGVWWGGTSNDPKPEE